MKNFIAFLAIAVMLINISGCKHEPSTRYICLLDISASIYPEEVDREFAEARRIAASMQRGEELTLIPITGNARNDTPGHVVRLAAPAARTPYDGDLVTFRKRAESEIERLKSWSKENPGQHTDIFGTLKMAQDYAPSGQPGVELIVASDLLEDEPEYRFTDDPRLRSPEGARRLAKILQSRFPVLNLSQSSVVRLRSRDAGRLSLERLSALDAFWDTLLTPRDASRPSARLVPSQSLSAK